MMYKLPEYVLGYQPGDDDPMGLKHVVECIIIAYICVLVASVFTSHSFCIL